MSGRTWAWTCKARRRSDGRPCGEELGVVEGGRLRVRIGLAVEAGPDGEVTVTCPASIRHHRVWRPRGILTANRDHAAVAGRQDSEARLAPTGS